MWYVVGIYKIMIQFSYKTIKLSIDEFPVIGSIIWGTWLFGIYKVSESFFNDSKHPIFFFDSIYFFSEQQKPNWMLPGLISAIAGICLLIVVTVYAVVTLWAYCFVFAILTGKFNLRILVLNFCYFTCFS